MASYITYLLDARSCCRLVNAPKLFRTVLKLARTWREHKYNGIIHKLSHYDDYNIRIIQRVPTCANGVTIISSPWLEETKSGVYIRCRSISCRQQKGTRFFYKGHRRDGRREEWESSHQINFSSFDRPNFSDMFILNMRYRLRPYFTARNTVTTVSCFSSGAEGISCWTCLYSCEVVWR